MAFGSMKPSTTVEDTGGDIVTVKVTPPEFMRLPTRHVDLTRDQYERYLKWRNRQMLIQEALPDLSADDREILISGIGNDAWRDIMGDDDNG